MLMMLRIFELEVLGDFKLSLVFNDGTRKRVNILSLLNGPIFEPLRARKTFAQARLDPECGTVVWPNGADLAPEALFELDDVPVRTNSPRKEKVGAR